MAPVGRLELAVVGAILVVLVLTGPIAGIVDMSARNPTTVGDGTAELSIERLDTDEMTIDRGRFGTGVMYLRLPKATVAAEEIQGNPRIVYSVRVPSLGVDSVATELLTGDTSTLVRLGPRDRGLDPDTVTADTYQATVTVRVQSFEQDRTVYQTNETVEVQR